MSAGCLCDRHTCPADDCCTLKERQDRHLKNRLSDCPVHGLKDGETGPVRRTCVACGFPKPATPDHFRPSANGANTRTTCIVCENRARKARRGSNYQALKPEDFKVGVGNDGRIDPHASAEKRQEYSEAMGEFADALHGAAEGAAVGEDPLDLMPEALGTYIGHLSEQERRFGNRRLARSVSLQAAHEALALRQFKQAAAMYLQGKIEPTGYALKPVKSAQKRTVVLFLSDLHLGADLSAMDNPVPFRAVEEARRLEYVIRQAMDYKPQYRSQSKLLLLLGGDLIEGYLQHDLRDGAPLTEQKVIFWRHLSRAIAMLAQVYPSVEVVCQPGNHGRDKLRHPGRATSSKWDGHEWQMYYALSMMASQLKNVTWSLPFRAVSVIDLHGSKALLTHGDTEIKLGHPDTQASQNRTQLDRINATQIYGATMDVVLFGHFHTPRHQPGNPTIVSNGMLVPANGHARSSGYINEPCGQWLWEAVEGHPVGDVRYIRVGVAQDKDERLGLLIPPFRFDMEAS